jgi:integrase
MMVLREDDADGDIGPNITSEASPQTAPARRIDISPRRFEAKLHWWTVPGTVTKNKLPHRVPLTKSARHVLETLKAGAEAEYVFSGIRGTRQRRGALENLKVDDVRPHDFRRTAASMMTSAGISRLTVAKVLNHVSADARVTAIYDRHNNDAEKRVALETWERTLLGIVKQKSGGKVKAFLKRP